MSDPVRGLVQPPTEHHVPHHHEPRRLRCDDCRVPVPATDLRDRGSFRVCADCDSMYEWLQERLGRSPQ